MDEQGKAEGTANPVQTTVFFRVKKGLCGDGVDGGNPLRSWGGLRGASHPLINQDPNKNNTQEVTVLIQVPPHAYQSPLVRGNPLFPWKGLDRRV